MSRTCEVTPVSDHDGPTIDNAYGGLVEADSDARWAFGTGFDDPLAGLDVAVPAGVDPAALAAYCLMLGDDALVMAQRLDRVVHAGPRARGGGRAGERRARPARPDPAALRARRRRRPGRGPGAPRGLAGAARGPAGVLPRTRATSAASGWSSRRTRTSPTRWSGSRPSPPGGWRSSRRSSGSVDPVLAAVAAKGVKEVRYHRDYAAGGSSRSPAAPSSPGERVDRALRDLWPLLAELGRPDDVHRRGSAGRASLPTRGVVAERLDRSLGELLGEAGLDAPAGAGRARHARPAAPDGPACTPDGCRRCSRRCRGSPARTRWGGGERCARRLGVSTWRRLGRWWPRSSTPSCRW